MPMKRIQHVSLFKILPFLFLLLFFSTGCKNKKKEKIVAQKKVGCVKIFIDKSASMAGYFKADAEFRSIVSDFASKINKEIPVPVEIFFISKSNL